MAAHGVSRSTIHMDLFSVGPAALDDGVWQALAADGIHFDVRHGDHDDPLLGVVRCSHGEQVIDLVVGGYAWQREVIARATPTRVFSLNLPIVALEDLLIRARRGGRAQRETLMRVTRTPVAQQGQRSA